MVPQATNTDEEYDRYCAIGGPSRYGEYLISHRNLFLRGDTLTDDPAMFAIAAWQVATAPIMAPGYVHTHDHIRSVHVHRDHDGQLLAGIELAVPATPILAHWCRSRAPWLALETPDAAVIALPLVTVQVPLPAAIEIKPAYRRGSPDLDTAKGAVRMICRAINATMTGALTLLEAVNVQ